MAKRLEPIGRVIGGVYEGSFVYWLIDQDKTEYFVISPNTRLRIGMFVRLEDNPITFEIRDGDIARFELKDTAFLHEDLDLFTKHRGKVAVRVNRQASEKLQSMSGEKRNKQNDHDFNKLRKTDNQNPPA